MAMEFNEIFASKRMRSPKKANQSLIQILAREWIDEGAQAQAIWGWMIDRIIDHGPEEGKGIGAADSYHADAGTAWRRGERDDGIGIKSHSELCLVNDSLGLNQGREV